MARLCTVCTDPRRDAIDRALTGGQPVRDIARHFAPLSRDALHRHLEGHVSPALQRIAARREDGRNITLLERVEAVIDDIAAITTTAREAGANGLQLASIDRMEKMLRMLGALTGELKAGDGPQVVINIEADPNWLRIRSVILEELDQHPDLKARIVARLAATAETGSLRSALPSSMVVANGIARGEVVSEQ